MRSRYTCLVLVVAALAATSRPARAELIETPPIVITQLTHQYIYDFESGDTWVQDFIAIPGTGYTCSGFTAAIGTGDVVRVRIVPPTGKKFRLRAHGGITAFHVAFYWSVPSPGFSPPWDPFTFAFENPTGPPPTLQPYTQAYANEVWVFVDLGFLVLDDFEFTALRVDITADQALAKIPRTYGDLRGSGFPPIAAFQDTTNPNLSIFEIVDDTSVPSVTSSWGRLKSLYR